jgi:hypothetical protein
MYDENKDNLMTVERAKIGTIGNEEGVTGIQ